MSKFLGFSGGGSSSPKGYSPNPNSGGSYSHGGVMVVQVQGEISHDVIALSNAKGTKARTIGRGV